MADIFEHLVETFIFKDLYKIRWVRLGVEVKPPLIFVHGTPFSSLLWLPFAQAMKKDYTIYLFDLPGFGASQETASSDKTDPDVSYAVHGEAFAALLNHCGFGSTNSPHVVAHDIGGHAVLRVHLLHGSKYASLLLMDVVAITPYGNPFMQSVKANPEAFSSISTAMFTGMLREYMQDAAYKKLSAAKMNEFVRPWVSNGGQSKRNFINQMRVADMKHTEEMQNDLGRVMESEDDGAKKLKILWAENDKWIPVERGLELKELTGASEFVRVEQAGHLIQVDQPETVMYEISKWLAKMTA